MYVSHILDNFAFNITHLSPTGNELKHVSIFVMQSKKIQMLKQSFKMYMISFIFKLLSYIFLRTLVLNLE